MLFLIGNIYLAYARVARQLYVRVYKQTFALILKSLTFQNDNNDDDNTTTDMKPKWKNMFCEWEFNMWNMTILLNVPYKFYDIITYIVGNVYLLTYKYTCWLAGLLGFQCDCKQGFPWYYVCLCKTKWNGISSNINMEHDMVDGISL